MVINAQAYQAVFMGDNRSAGQLPFLCGPFLAEFLTQLSRVTMSALNYGYDNYVEIQGYKSTIQSAAVSRKTFLACGPPITLDGIAYDL